MIMSDEREAQQERKPWPWRAGGDERRWQERQLGERSVGNPLQESSGRDRRGV